MYLRRVVLYRINWTQEIYQYTYKTLVVLIDWLFEAVRTNPGYGMATLIYNNLLNLILGTVILLIISFRKRYFCIYLSNF